MERTQYFIPIDVSTVRWFQQQIGEDHDVQLTHDAINHVLRQFIKENRETKETRDACSEPTDDSECM